MEPLSMTSETMTPHNPSDFPQTFSEITQFRRKRFVSVCRGWENSRQLADDLAEIGLLVSERTCDSWRSDSFKKLNDSYVQGVKLAVQLRKLKAAKAFARQLEEAAAL
jgi:hypothetical protein